MNVQVNELLCPGHSHNHQPGREGENCQEPRTCHSTLCAPYQLGRLLSPHSLDLVPRFSL